MSRVAYKFSPEKALQAIHHMVSQRQRLDLHTALKACYFADKSHLNAHLQPIFGATYRAMKYGPVPLEIYELIKGESLWLWEVGRDRLPWTLEGYNIVEATNDPASLSEFSLNEAAHLDMGIATSCAMSFTSRTAATHGPDWQKANGGIMSYEDMLEDRPDREQAIQYMRETSRYVRL